MALAERSLLVPTQDPRTDDVRFRMLTTIRVFAAERLIAEGEPPSIRRRHCLAFLDLAEAIAPDLDGPDQARGLDRLAIDHANLRAAVRWAIDGGYSDLAQRFLAALWRFWHRNGLLHEGR